MKHKKNNKFSLKLVLIPIIITILVMIIFVPVHISGGIVGYNKNTYRPLSTEYFKKQDDTCCDQISYSVLTDKYIIEGIITFTISLGLTIIIKNKKE